MKTTLLPKQAEFAIHQPDNQLLVENVEEGVVIHALYDNLTETRKCFFIREIAAEGYIPDQYQWLGSLADCFPSGVVWIIDRSWLQIPEAVRRSSRRLVVRSFVAACVLWLILMGFVLAHAPRAPGF